MSRLSYITMNRTYKVKIRAPFPIMVSAYSCPPTPVGAHLHTCLSYSILKLLISCYTISPCHSLSMQCTLDLCCPYLVLLHPVYPTLSFDFPPSPHTHTHTLCPISNQCQISTHFPYLRFDNFYNLFFN